MRSDRAFSPARRTLLAAGATTLASGLGLRHGPAEAQSASYPGHPITMVVPFAPGGATDVPARIIQPKLGEILGQQVVVDNRDGANGIIGLNQVARAKPDGYTIALTNVGSMAVNEHIYKDMPFKPLTDLAAVSLVCDIPGIVVASKKFPPNSMAELLAYIKQNPGKVTFASPGVGSVNRLQVEELALSHGLQLLHVPYKGGAGPMTDLMAGRIDFMFLALATGLPQIKGGRIKVLGASTRQRLPQLPDVPTLAEQGFPKNVTSSWQGVFVPASTPAPVIQTLYDALVRTVNDPGVQAAMAEAGLIPVTSASPKAFQDFVAADSAKWGDVVRRANVRAE
ncbi:MAG: tripartite tricarboxylate transporter substrate binding protein [Pigmentiphaga sp.]|uniref:Bug family tripartite tricarboxylate transporter substrate binding protein n=1 Tax=Pigmentiphaga sp. TaxID=1977564 RepID=UPI0029B4D455|nr:tripartite tricarboxylate transporter substrate binding protein [Pigmentiphaga sp.]MDX3907435.1 tripartite tricarboxylate transporter substrate binding protein [Pigmentiphaga sp.]